MKHLKEFDSIGKLHKHYKNGKIATPNVYSINNQEVYMGDEYDIICIFDTTNNLYGSSDLLTNYDMTSLESYTIDGVKHNGDDLPLNITRNSIEPGLHIVKLRYKNKNVFGNSNSSPVFYNSYLRKIIIPSGIDTLNTNVFLGIGSNISTPIFELKIPKTVKRLSNSNTTIFTSSKIKYLDLSEINENLFNELMNGNSGAYIDELMCPNIETLTSNLFSGGSKQIKKINLGNSLKTIEAGAFSNNSYLEEVIIPNTVTTIGENCFNYCSNLKKFNISDSLTSIPNGMFSNCSSLEKVNISNNSSLTSIGNSAFGLCRALTEINIPNSVTSIGNYAFYYCQNLSKVNMPNSLTSIGEYAFAYSKISNIIISNNLINVGAYSFDVNYNINTNVYLDNSTITNLSNIINSSSVKNLEFGPNSINQNGELITMLNQFGNMENIIFPEGITRLPSLNGNTSLKTFNVPTTVTSISENFVAGCDKLEEAYIEGGIKYIDIDNFGTYIINVADNTLQHYTIKNGVTSLISIFSSSLINVQGITLPDSITYIPNSCFNNLYDNDILTPEQIEFILNINPNAISEISKLMKKPNSYFEDKYMSIYTLSSGSIFYEFADAAESSESANYKELEYSKDGGETWYSINNIGTGSSKTGSISKSISSSSGETIYFRGAIEPITRKSVYVNSKYVYVGGIGKFYSNARYYVFGNVMSLLYGDNFEDKKSLSSKDYVFLNLFSCEIQSSSYKTNLLRADKLILPAITLSKFCYGNMFNNNTSLTKAPELPATSLSEFCYEYMFKDCTSLSKIPSELPATVLSGNCYLGMFNNCNKITIAPELPATSISAACYESMFSGCTSLTTAPELPATTMKPACYMNMFTGCSSLTTAPELPATTLEYDCYYNMFTGCSSLTTAPELPATTLTDSCYYAMFSGCTSLTAAPELPATTLANNCYQYMFSRCTLLTESPILPATTLVKQCYQYMFSNCKNLSKITMLATSIPSGDVYDGWVIGVSSTGTFIKAPGVSIPTANINSHYKGIPEGWTVVDYVETTNI